MTQNSNPKAKNILNDPKLTLVAQNPTVKGKWSKLSFGIYNNNPRLIVSTNSPDLQNQENNYGRITAALDNPAFFTFLELLKQSINSKEAIKYKVENFGFKKGEDPKTPAHLTDLWVGRGEDGVIFISVINKAEGWPTIKFTFGPSDIRYHKFYHGNGTEFSKAEISTLYAKAYSNILQEVVSTLIVDNFVEPPPYNGGNKSGGYNKNNNYNKGNSYQAKSEPESIVDDDIPF